VDVVDVLARAVREGFLTPEASAKGVDHAQVARWSMPSPPRSCVDLGSGGGLPAFALAELWPDSEWQLTEQRATRASFLRWAISALGWNDRMSVVEGDVGADRFSWWEDSSVDLVTARSFGPRAVVVEVASGILRPEGELLVSEKQDGDEWQTKELLAMGFELVRSTSTKSGAWRLLSFNGEPDRNPRSPASIRKSPRFTDPAV
jgi:16S rRNA G527 N7-methylase RsmG